MVKIAFCDDDLSALNELQILLDQYRVDRNQALDYSAFHSPLDLMAAIEHGLQFDVIFLDILMPGQNGIETAQEIREHDSNVKIIFLSSSPEFAVQSYHVNAFFYQLKPIREESLFRVMDSVLEVCEKEPTYSLILRCKTGITRVEPRQIEYCEVLHRTLLIHLSSGNILECTGSLEDLSTHLLPYGGFLRPHRSYLVNLEYVHSVSYKSITMFCQTEIPIPRGKYNEVKTAFLSHTFQTGTVTI